MADVCVGVLLQVGRWWTRVGDVETYVDLFFYFPVIWFILLWFFLPPSV